MQRTEPRVSHRQNPAGAFSVGRPLAAGTARLNSARLSQVTSIGNIRNTYELGPDDVSYLVMPLFHVHGLMSSLFAGGPAVAGPLLSPPPPSRFLVLCCCPLSPLFLRGCGHAGACGANSCLTGATASNDEVPEDPEIS